MAYDMKSKKKKMGIADLEMPKKGGAEEVELDVDFLADEGEMDEMSEPMGDLEKISDEELMAELERRGLMGDMAEDDMDMEDMDMEEDMEDEELA